MDGLSTVSISGNSSDRNASENNTDVFSFPEPYKSIREAINWAILGLVFMSVTGNTLIIIVMSRKQNRNTSTSIFFTALAISDMLLSLSVSFERWLHWTFAVSVYGVSPLIAKIKTVLNYSNIHISSCLLVCITIERVISIAIPHRIKFICTKLVAKVAVFLLCGGIIALNIFCFTYIVDFVFEESKGIKWVKRFENSEQIIAWVDFSVSFFVPITVIISGSVFIVINLLRMPVRKHDSRGNRNRSVTMTLLAANTTFVLTMSPFVVFRLAYPSEYGLDFSVYLFWTLGEVFMFLSDMNSALNFFVYVLSGSKFRSDVLHILCCKESTFIADSMRTGTRRLTDLIRNLSSFTQLTQKKVKLTQASNGSIATVSEIHEAKSTTVRKI